MRESQAIIERVRQIGGRIQQISLAVEDASLEQIKSGQTLLVDTPITYLRENWIPTRFDEDEGVLVVEHPIQYHYTPGDVVSIIGPIGTPLSLRSGVRNLLLIAEDYPPIRLLFFLHHALSRGISVALVLTGSAKNYPITELPPTVEIVNSDDITTWPNQRDTLHWADQVVAITDPVFWEERFHALHYQASERMLPRDFIYGIIDLPIPCGTGACMACMVRTRNGNKLACLDGSAFDLTQVKFS